jgi:hypothetical protein
LKEGLGHERRPERGLLYEHLEYNKISPKQKGSEEVTSIIVPS